MPEIDERFGSLEDRITKAEKRFSELEISGPGWAGNPDEGFTFNPRLIHGSIVSRKPLPICGPTPDSLCTHTICFTATVLASEVVNGIGSGGSSGDFVDLINTSNNVIGVYIDYSVPSWFGYFNDGSTFNQSGVTTTAIALTNTPHFVSLAIYPDPDNPPNVVGQITVDGVSSGKFVIPPAAVALNWDRLRVGSSLTFGVISHRKITNVHTTVPPSSGETQYNFPADSFTLSTGGVVYSLSGIVVNDDVGDAYEEKTISPVYKLENCPEMITLACDTISSSLTKCFWAENFFGCALTDSPRIKYFFKLTTTITWSIDHPFSPTDCTSSGNVTFVAAYVLDTSFSCVALPLSVSGSVTLNGVTTGLNASNWTNYIEAGNSGAITFQFPDGSGCPPITVDSSTTGYETDCPGSFTFHDSATPTDPPDTSNGNYSRTNVFSVEYPTGDLIANVESNLPDYDGVYDDTCSASRNLSTDEVSYSIQRFRPQFSFTAVTFSRTLHYKEHFVPTVGVPSDTNRMIPVASGVTSVVGPEVIEPASNGTITITAQHFTTP